MNGTRRSGPSKKNRGRIVGPNPSHPPSRNLTPLMTHVFRFQASTQASQVAVSRGGLLNLIGFGVLATSTGARLFGAVKLRKIRVWSPIVSGFAPQLITVEWTGLNAPSSLHSDSSEGLTPATVHTSPPPDSSADWWSISGQNESEVLMLITCPSASIIDVTVDIRLADNESAVSFAQATLASGQVGYGRLDGTGTNASSGVLPASGGVSPF